MTAPAAPAPASDPTCVAPADVGLSPAQAAKLMFMHHPDPKHPAEEFVAGLLELAVPGTLKIRVLTGRDADYYSDK